MRVLIAEDNDNLRELLEQLFQESPVDAVFAPGGKEAFDLFYQSCQEGKRFDGVITDLAMSGIGGYTLAALIRVVEGLHCPTKLAAMTAHGREMINPSLMEKYRIEKCWFKPDDLIDLPDKVLEWLSCRYVNSTER